MTDTIQLAYYLSGHVDIRRRVISLLKDNAAKLTTYSPTVWLANTSYSSTTPSRVKPTTYDTIGHTYKCNTSGVSHATTEPVFPYKPGNTVADGTVVWEEDSDEIDTAIIQALKSYSKDNPDQKTVNIIGNGSSDYSLPASWVDDFSDVISIEYPINDIPANLLDDRSFQIYQTTTENKIRLLDDKPSVTESFNLKFTIPRLIGTIPPTHTESFSWLATAFCFIKLSNLYSHATDSSLSISELNATEKSNQYSKRAEDLIKLYKDFMGITLDGGQIPKIGHCSLDHNYPFNIDRLTHSRIQRLTR